MSGWLSARTLTVIVLLAALVLLPVYVEFTGNRFLLTLFTRIIILALAAVSLNLILGFGGMMSFGHAVYLGIGGYAVGMLAHEGIYSGFVQWPVALAASVETEPIRVPPGARSPKIPGFRSAISISRSLQSRHRRSNRPVRDANE